MRKRRFDMALPVSVCALALMLPLFVAADVLTCRYTIECFEQEGCTDTDWQYLAEFNTAEGGAGTIVTDAETIILYAFEGPESSYWHLQGMGPAGAHLATITADGSARHVTHIPDGPLQITYYGTCEGAD